MNKRNDPFSDFDLNDFKKWMTHQQDEENKPNMVGLRVESKITGKKLLSRIEAQEGETLEIVRDFKKNGGIISEVNGQNILIEVESGSFLIHKMYIKKS